MKDGHITAAWSHPDCIQGKGSRALGQQWTSHENVIFITTSIDMEPDTIRVPNLVKPLVDAQPTCHADIGDGASLRDPLKIHSSLLLAAMTVACLLPFCGRAFHIDDTLFIWAAQNIVKHPFDPYGFHLVWEYTRVQMSEVTQNPPLASYYSAIIGSLFGWSEWALHLGFLPISVLLVIGTLRLAKRFTRLPWLAALATLLTPGLLASASSIMCDVMMLAIWIWAAVFWIEGLPPRKPFFLITSGVLIAAASFTKYFGVSLVLLLLAYSLFRERRIGRWVLYLLIPVVALIGYQVWTAHLYQQGLLSAAAQFAEKMRANEASSPVARAIVGLSYGGGCAITGLVLAPLVWSRKTFLALAVPGILAALSITLGVVSIGWHAGGAGLTANGQWGWATTVQLALCVTGGLSIIVLGVMDFWEEQTAEALFLMMWILGTFFFAAFVNWVINARSVLPLVPAVGILVARRIEKASSTLLRPTLAKIAVALLLCGFVSLSVAQGDAALANSARRAATLLSVEGRSRDTHVWFLGHWGFQYYMELQGARPVDWNRPVLGSGDLLVVPSNNVNMMRPDLGVGVTSSYIDVPIHSWVSTISAQLGACFYSSYWGPLPYAFGPIAPERYRIMQFPP